MSSSPCEPNIGQALATHSLFATAQTKSSNKYLHLKPPSGSGLPLVFPAVQPFRWFGMPSRVLCPATSAFGLLRLTPWWCCPCVAVLRVICLPSARV